MHHYNRLLVGISFVNPDGSAIRYAGLISRLSKSEKVTFLHVVNQADVPEQLRKEYPELFTPVGEYARKEMENLVNTYFDGDPETLIEYKVMEGSHLIEFLRLAKEQETDLIIMRKRKYPSASGTLFEKLARKAPCSVLFVPEGADAWFNNILVYADFSENSVDAMKTAISLASVSEGITQITCLHVYSVPSGYYKTGKTYDQFADIMRGHAAKKYAEFIKALDLQGFNVVPLFHLHKNLLAGIEEVVNKCERCLVVAGARGRMATAGVLLGSVAQHLIRTTTSPLLAVKKKGENMNILEMLFSL